jgi:hypothetical protein
MGASAAQAPASRRLALPATGAAASRGIATLIALVLALHLNLALTRSINWDEFHFLTQVHEFARGELTSPLQTFHVHLFDWLAASELSAVDQIVRARLVMFAAMLGTSAAIVAIALRFTALPGALVCALAYLTVGYVMHHGAAFRTDPLAAFLCMSALAIIARARLGPLAILAAAAALGLALMVTIKMALYLPAFAGIAWLRWSEAGFSRSRAAILAAIPALALTVVAALYGWHASTLGEAEAAAATLKTSGANMFGLSPNLIFVATATLGAIPLVLLLALLPRALVAGEQHERDARIALAGLAAPLASLVFYTNTYPYFYAFILPPVCAALAGVIPQVSARWGLIPAAVMMAGNGALIWAIDGRSQQDAQRRIETAVNTMFPQPIAYFDFPGFLPRHQKANFFMTVWGFNDYRTAGEAHFAQIMDRTPVPLLLAAEPEENPSLLAVMQGTQNQRLFHRDDLTALRESYRQVWGPVYLAGTTLGAAQSRRWNVRVPGPYTVEGRLTIDGTAYAPGDVVTLSRGPINLAAGNTSAAGLLYGENLKLPDTPPPARPYWRGF